MEFRSLDSRKCILKCRLQKGSHLVSASVCLNTVYGKYECMAISSMTRIRRQDDRSSHHRRRWRQASAPPVTTRAATSTTYPFLLLYDHHDHRVAQYSIQSRRLTYICVDELCQHWFRQWLVAWTAPSQYPGRSAATIMHSESLISFNIILMELCKTVRSPVL